MLGRGGQPMQDRSAAVANIAAPIKQLIQRFSFAILIAGSVGLMVLGKFDNVLMEAVRVRVVDAFVPIMNTLAQPAAVIARTVETGNQLWAVHEINQQLREENERLRLWKKVALQLDAENQSLRALMSYSGPSPTYFITAKIVGESTSIFVRSVIIDRGAGDGVEKGQLALLGEAVVGRVIAVGRRSARVLLITDLNARLPVVLHSTRDKAILAGTNGRYPRLLYLGDDVVPTDGDLVVTSGTGGAAPDGLPVGTIVVRGDGYVVEPYADLSRLEHLRIMDYALDLTDLEQIEQTRR